MEQIFSKLKFITNGEGFIDITYDLNLLVEKNNFHSGILNLTSLHTSCSLTINENADPNVLMDLKKYMQSIVPYDSYLTLSKDREEISYKHYQEGADDMPAHIKTSLTNTCLSLSFQDSNILLGTWQAVYLWEHRFDQKERVLNAHIIGEKRQNIYNGIN
jgi:secondary thiamine-phosphate synthase enzyme